MGRSANEQYNDVMQRKALDNTDTTTWFNEFVKVYLNTYLVGLKIKDCICKLNSEVVVIKAWDSNELKPEVS